VEHAGNVGEEVLDDRYRVLVVPVFVFNCMVWECWEVRGGEREMRECKEGIENEERMD